MKIHYRKPDLLEQMNKAIADSKEPIDHFELTPEEFNQHFSSFDKSFQRDIGTISRKRNNSNTGGCN